MHSSLITCCLILIIVLFSSQSSFSSRLKDEVNSIKITNEPSKVIKYKYPHHYHHNNRKFHPKHLDHLRLFKQQVLDAPSDSVDRSRRSQLHTVRVVSTDVSFSIDSNGSSVLKGSRNRSRSHVLGREDPSSLAEAAATDNLNNVLSYRCHHPKPRIVYLDQTTLGKQYWPRATIMHRCSDDTGCCVSDAYTCSPQSQEEVKAYFFVRSNNSTDIEEITFTNHTRCHCQEINPKPRLTISRESWSSNSNLIDEPIDFNSPLIKPISWSTTASPSSTVSEPISKSAKSKESHLGDAACQGTAPCPEPFKWIRDTPNVDSGAPFKCSCDCASDTDTECIMMKLGLRSLSSRSNRCVSTGHCQPPRCQFGREYDTVQQRCPRERGTKLVAFQQKKRHERE